MKLQFWRFSETIWDICLEGHDEGGELLMEGSLSDLKRYAFGNMKSLPIGQSGFKKISDGEIKKVGSEDVYLLIDMNNDNTLTRIMKNPIGQTFIKRKFWKGSLLEVIKALEAYIISLENQSNG